MGKPGGCDVVSLYHGWAGCQGQAVSKEYLDCTAVAADEQGLFERQENWPPQRIYHACFGDGIPDSADKKFPGQDL